MILDIIIEEQRQRQGKLLVGTLPFKKVTKGIEWVEIT